MLHFFMQSRVIITMTLIRSMVSMVPSFNYRASQPSHKTERKIYPYVRSLRLFLSVLQMFYICDNSLCILEHCRSAKPPYVCQSIAGVPNLPMYVRALQECQTSLCVLEQCRSSKYGRHTVGIRGTEGLIMRNMQECKCDEHS